MEVEKEERILSERIISAEVIKVFHLYKRRNEWLNWDGDTGLINRSRQSVKLTLDEAEVSAEKARRQGSKFIIDEVPALKISSKTGFLIITELFTKQPLKEFEDNNVGREHLDKLKSVKKVFLNSEWSIQTLYKKSENSISTDSTYFSRVSSPGESLCWSLSYRDINECSIKNINAKISKLISLPTTT